MSRALSSIPLQLPEIRGKTLIRRENIGTAMRMAQTVSLVCRRLSSTEPGLALIRAGRKIIKQGTHETIVPAGSAVIFGSGFEVDIVNETAVDGIYCAEVIYFHSDILSLIAKPGTTPVEGCCPLPEFSEGLGNAMSLVIASMGNPELPDEIVSHRLRELLLWVEARGHCIVKPRTQDLVTRVRALFMADPSAEWPSQKVATTLAMSEATLRRNLAKAGTTLTDIIIDVRMTAALIMLQSTETSITEVSFAVGYESPSRFAMRFRSRFGFAPSELRRA